MATTSGTSAKQEKITVPVAAVAGGADAESVVAIAPFTGFLSAVKYYTVSAITGANTNTRTVSARNSTATLVPATISFTSGVNSTGLVAKTITAGNAANIAVTEGDVITWYSLHVGTGIADPGGTIELTFTRD